MNCSTLRFIRVSMAFVLGLASPSLLLPEKLQAAPYASRIQVAGTSVYFILNERADSLYYQVNNSYLIPLDGSTKGLKTFSLPTPSASFAIIAGKNDPVGYAIPTGGTIAASASGLSQSSPAAGFELISDDANLLNRFNSPRGVSVSINPGAPNFGVVYVANSAAGSASGRLVGDGLYALNPDQTDAFGYGDTAQDPGNFFDGVSASANSPFKVFAATNGDVYTADFSDANSDVYRAKYDLTAPAGGGQLFTTIGGPSTLPPGQNHGSSMAVYVEGSLANGDLVVYSVDEDLRTPGFDDRSSLWRYPIGAGPLPSSVAPTRVNQAVLLTPLALTDVQHGTDGKWYLTQNRVAGTEAGLFVLDANGALIFNSLTESGGSVDILRNIQAAAVSPDQKWLALMLNNSDVAVVPLVNGIPDLFNRMVVDTGTDVNSGRDISFDAAGNIHYVSSGQALYRVIAPGGQTWATTSRNAAGIYTFVPTFVSGPYATISQNGGQVRIDWMGGVLQESTSPAGPWSNSANQTSPLIFTPAPNAPTKFYRVSN